MRARTWRDDSPERVFHGPSRRPRWGHWRGKESVFWGVQQRLWLQREAKLAKMAFLVIFHVTSSILYMLAMESLLRKKKHKKTVGK